MDNIRTLTNLDVAEIYITLWPVNEYQIIERVTDVVPASTEVV